MNTKEIDSLLSDIATSWVDYVESTNTCDSMCEIVQRVMSGGDKDVVILVFEITRSSLYIEFYKGKQYYKIMGKNSVQSLDSEQDREDRPEVDYDLKCDLYLVKYNERNVRGKQELFYYGGSYEC